jgi:PAS domain-containing protein
MPGVEAAGWLDELVDAPIPTGVFELDGTFVAVSRAGEALLGRPRAQVVGRKAWDLAPGAEHIWSEVLAAVRGGGEYRGDIVVATPQEPRRVAYIAMQSEHAGASYVFVVAVAIGDERARGGDEAAVRHLEHAAAALRAKLR